MELDHIPDMSDWVSPSAQRATRRVGSICLDRAWPEAAFDLSVFCWEVSLTLSV
jgi:hypothetical protein